MFLLILGILIFCIGFVFNKNEALYKFSKPTKYAGVLIFFIGLISNCFVQVDAGQVGVKKMFGKISAILDGGQCEVGLESTIIDLTEKKPTILRPGGLSLLEIEKVLNEKIIVNSNLNEKVSGNLINHYQPKALVHSIKTSEIENLTEDPLGAKSVLLLLSDINTDNIQTYSMPSDPYKYGQILYYVLLLWIFPVLFWQIVLNRLRICFLCQEIFLWFWLLQATQQLLMFSLKTTNVFQYFYILL